MDKWFKTFKYGILAIVLISIAVIDIRVLNNIGNRDVESYYVWEYYQQSYNIQKSDFCSFFTPVEDKLMYLSAQASTEEGVVGKVSYYIYDKTDKLIYQNEMVDIGKLYDASTNTIKFDVSEAEFVRGNEYKIRTVLDINQPFWAMGGQKGYDFTQTYHVTYKKLLYVLLVVVNVIILAFLVTFIKWGLNTLWFTTLSLMLGIGACVFTVPHQQPDEFRHFVRAYDLSCGGAEWYMSPAGPQTVGLAFLRDEDKACLVKIPMDADALRLTDYSWNYNQVSYYAEVNMNLNISKLLSIFKSEEAEGEREVSEDMTVYRGIENYWPEVAGISLARLIGVRPAAWYYFACIAQAIMSAMIFGLAFKLAGPWRNAIVFTALIPQMPLLQGSCNPDGMMYAYMALGFSIISYIRHAKIDLLSKKNLPSLLGYTALVLIVFKMKPPYAVIMLGFVILLAKENIGIIYKIDKKKKRAIIAVSLAVILLLGIYVFAVRKGDVILPLIYKFVSKEHFDYILAHFGDIVSLFGHAGIQLLTDSVYSIRGDWVIPYYALFIAVFALCKRDLNIPKKVYMVFLFFVMLGFIVLAGYTLTPPDYGTIWGITYRYIIPSWMFLGMALPAGNEKTQIMCERIYPMILLPVMFASVCTWGQIY